MRRAAFIFLLAGLAFHGSGVESPADLTEDDLAELPSGVTIGEIERVVRIPNIGVRYVCGRAFGCSIIPIVRRR